MEGEAGNRRIENASWPVKTGVDGSGGNHGLETGIQRLLASENKRKKDPISSRGSAADHAEFAGNKETSGVVVGARKTIGGVKMPGKINRMNIIKIGRAHV